MKKAVKMTGILFCSMFVIALLQCSGDVKLRGVYSAVDNSNDSVEFISGSKVAFDLDGEKNEGTYKIHDSSSFKQITITVKNSPKYILFIIIDENTIRRINREQIFKKETKQR